MDKPRIKIHLVDDHPLVREWLTNLINRQPDLVVSGESEDAPHALQGISATQPDVAIVDISLKLGSGLELIKNLKTMQPDLAVIVLSMHDERLYAERALRAGARGYIMKSETAKKVIAVIRQVLAGKIYMSESMAAVFAAVISGLKAGDRLVAPRALFGSCLYIVKDLAPKYGIEAVIIDGADLEQWRAALSRPTQLVFLETPSNPMLEVIDLKVVCGLAHAAGALVVVDNVFATPVLQRPLKLGADVVVYSATKHIDGQGRCLGGIILCSNAFAEIVHPFLRHTGPALSPFNAWVLLNGLVILNVSPYVQQLLIGAIIVGAVTFDVFVKRWVR